MRLAVLCLALLLAACSPAFPTPVANLPAATTEPVTPTLSLPTATVAPPTSSQEPRTPTAIPPTLTRVVPTPTLAPAFSGLALYRGDVGRTGVYASPGIRAQPSIRWEKRGLGLGVHGAPVVAGGVVYVPTQNGLLRAFTVAAGELLWTFGQPGEIVSSPAIVDDTVYVTRERTFYALDAASGVERWSFAASATLYSAPLAVADRVYFASQAGQVFALDRQDGALQWETELGGFLLWPIAHADGRLFVGINQHLVGLDAATGEELWRASDGEGWSPHAVAGGHVYAGNADGAFYSLDAHTGAVVWRHATTGGDWSAPAVGRGRVYAGNRDQTIYAFDTATGAQAWAFAAEDWAVADPVLAGGILYIGVGNHDRREGPRHLYALDAASGAELWRFRGNGRLLSAPVIDAGVLYVLTTLGALYALE